MVTLDPEAFQNAVVKLTDVYGAVVLAIHETIRNFAARREAINMQWAKTCTNSLCKHASLPPDHRLLWQIVLWKCRATCCPQHLHSFILRTPNLKTPNETFPHHWGWIECLKVPYKHGSSETILPATEKKPCVCGSPWKWENSATKKSFEAPSTAEKPGSWEHSAVSHLKWYKLSSYPPRTTLPPQKKEY